MANISVGYRLQGDNTSWRFMVTSEGASQKFIVGKRKYKSKLYD